MARRTIIIDGDASGLKTAASAATQTLKTELDAQKKALADARNAQKALTREATADERAAAKAVVQAANEGLAAKKKAYAEAAAAAKVAAAAVRQAAREEAATMKQMADAARMETRRQARGAEWQQGGAGDTGGGSSSAGKAAESAKRFAAAMVAAVASVERTIAVLTQLESKLLDRTLSANEIAGKRTESLRLAGMSTGAASDLGARIGGLAGNMSSAQLTSALDQLASEGSGRIGGSQVEAVLKASGRDSAGSALVAASFGLRSNDAVALAERYRTQTRGGSLGRDQGAAIGRLMAGGQLGGVEGVADYLAAAQRSGVNLDDIDGKMPFLNQPAGLHQAYIANRSRASSRQSAASILEIQRNQAQGLVEASLATDDQAQAQALLIQSGQISAEQADLRTAAEGPSGRRAVRQALGTFGADGLAARSGLLPNQDRPIEVKVINQPRTPADR
jgi:hypothetical protein